MVQERPNNTGLLGIVTSVQAPEELLLIPAILVMSRVAARDNLLARNRCLVPSPLAMTLGPHPRGSPWARSRCPARMVHVTNLAFHPAVSPYHHNRCLALRTTVVVAWAHRPPSHRTLTDSVK